ncbi:MAG: phosphatase PAP2 family protein [Flavobacteriaceae bacterium]|jgi:undecaprenyl-diphosphatase|nr:phosphatase PAP2 family protein [Flavobacteriaceae bacterium]MBR39649.1 phosphatase PAP2 family protein [Flavobacteriaceae bacterium]MBT04000.1 phosphatase PAP2 family protein [Crocinitomicaceae bacterium]|tara:strand:- start:3071 stop:3646 length:576 start_codon:yes stop_codon:yes gene_type:complete
MLDRIKQIDTELLIFLNNLGNKSWDPLWVSITDKFTFLPLFILIIFFLFKKNGTKGLLVILLFISVLILFTDQFTNVVKDFTQRLRPCRLDELQGLLRDIDIRCGKYGFFSAHAANSISVTIFIINCVDESVKKFLKPVLILWVMIFSYSRIYLGVHYPLDTIFGLSFGIFSGFLFKYIYNYFISVKVFSD